MPDEDHIILQPEAVEDMDTACKSNERQQPVEAANIWANGRSRTYRIIFTVWEDTVSVLDIRSSAQDDLKPE